MRGLASWFTMGRFMKRRTIPDLDFDIIDTKTFMLSLGIPFLIPGDLHYQKQLQAAFERWRRFPVNRYGK